MVYLGQDGKPTVIRTREGDRTMPSHVAFTKFGRVVGINAKTQVISPAHAWRIQASVCVWSQSQHVHY